MVALAVPLAASAGDGNGKAVGKDGTYVAPGLLQKAEGNPGQKVRVIIQSSAGTDAAEAASKGMGSLTKRLGLVGAVAMEMPAARLAQLRKVPGLTITEDAEVRPLGYSSTQLWPHENGVSKLWGTDKSPAPKAPTIAIVDSGIDASRLDFAGRKVTDIKMSSLADSAGDGRGHGTFVAGIAAGGAPGYAGAAPNADIVMLDVMDDSGKGLTSDVIAAAEWIHQNKDAYGIRVANFSLHSGSIAPFHVDPLNRAVEKLWFSGIVVVAAAGNYGSADGPSGVRYAPGNDPFVITVGAVDIGGTAKVGDDGRAPWSAYGRTYDGFWKPEICASGRYMVGPIPASSTLAQQRADKLVGGGYIELSGTSFAAPVVSGIAAQILARNPDWTPDMVKGALMKRARAVPQAAPLSCGVGQINAAKSVLELKSAPNPNLALNRYVVTDPTTGMPVFDAVSWADVSWADVSWDSVSWADVSWADVSWTDVSWADVSWADVSWTDVSWTDVSWEDAAEGDSLDAGYQLTPEEELAAATDPDLIVPGEETLESTTSATTSTTESTTSEVTSALG